MRIATLFVAIIALDACGADTRSTNSMASPLNVTSDRPAWQYFEQRDEMRGMVSRTAMLTATDVAPSRTSSDDGSSLSLIIESGEPIAMARLAHGQFDCPQSCYATIKFDNDAPVDLRGTRVPCGEYDCMQLAPDDPYGTRNDVGYVMHRMRHARRVILEVFIYRFGRYQFHFDAGDFQQSRL